MKRGLGVLLGLLVAAGLGAQATRIVVAGGAITETVFALGQGNRVVGVDVSSLFPAPEVTRLPQIGYVRQLSAEGVLSLAPDLLLTTADAGPPAVLAQIRGAGVRVEVVPEALSWDEAKARIQTIAGFLGVPQAGQTLANQLEGSRTKVDAFLKTRMGPPPRVLFIYSRGAGTLMASGTGTEADAMVRLAGAANALPQYSGYRPLTAEAVAAARPDVILFTTRGLQSLGGRPGLGALPAFADGVTLAKARVVDLDDLLLLGFGPRLGQAVEALTEQLWK